jgi:hypothetical protein
MPLTVSRPARFSLLVGLSATLVGCYVPVPETVYSSCKAIASANWKARFERGERNGILGAPRLLVVEGDVTVPAGGYALSLEEGARQRNAPYFLQVHLRTDAQGDVGTQAVTTRHVVGRLSVGKKVPGVHIRCGDALIAEIPAIEPEPSA